MESRLFRLIEPKAQLDSRRKIFSNASLMRMIVPLFFEQLLTMMVGIADTFMISYAGDAAVSGVSLVNMFVTIFIYLFTALAAGGAVVVSQYIGSGNKKESNRAAGQVVLTVFVISLSIVVFCILGGERLLRLIFGTVEDSVMENAVLYFMITVISYPFLGLFSAGAAFYRASGNSKFPTKVSVVSNMINVTAITPKTPLTLQRKYPEEQTDFILTKIAFTGFTSAAFTGLPLLLVIRLFRIVISLSILYFSYSVNAIQAPNAANIHGPTFANISSIASFTTTPVGKLAELSI